MENNQEEMQDIHYEADNRFFVNEVANRIGGEEQVKELTEKYTAKVEAIKADLQRALSELPNAKGKKREAKQFVKDYYSFLLEEAETSYHAAMLNSWAEGVRKTMHNKLRWPTINPKYLPTLPPPPEV